MNHTIKTLAADVRKFMLDRIQGAGNADLFAIASSLCVDDERATPDAPGCPAGELAAAKPRFTKLDLHGFAVNTADWVAVYDAETNLTWTRKLLECGGVNHNDAMTACANYRLFGLDDWSAPTVRRRVSINDYTKFGPALYPEFDAGSASHEWTIDVDAEDPSGFAWIVGLHNGSVLRLDQTYHSFVRAVRVGQPLSLGI